MLRLACSFLMLCLGFKAGRINGLTYWYSKRDGFAGPQKTSPVLFFHGLGVGLIPYVALLRTLAKQRSVIVVEQPWIAMSLDFDVPSPESFLENVRLLLKRFSPNGAACVVGHSYGSVPAAWMCHQMPEAVQELLLLDPVSMLLAEPTTVRTMLYSDRSSWAGWFSWYFVSGEVGTAYVLRRHFHWYNQVLFASDINRVTRSLVVLGGSDHIVPSTSIAEHLECIGTHAEVLLLDGFHHGQLLWTPWLLSRIEKWLSPGSGRLHDAKIGTECWEHVSTRSSTPTSLMSPIIFSRPLQWQHQELDVSLAKTPRGQYFFDLLALRT